MGNEVIAMLDEQLFPFKHHCKNGTLPSELHGPIIQKVTHAVNNRNLTLGARRTVISWLNTEYGISI